VSRKEKIMDFVMNVDPDPLPLEKVMTGESTPVKELMRLHSEGKISDEMLFTEFQMLGALSEEKPKVERKKKSEKEPEKPPPGGRLLDI
jgi:hypothetical protein